MPYEQTPGQQHYLRKKYAKARDEETGCDCPGCDTCKGFVRNCTCDIKRLSHYEERDPS